MGGVGAAGAAGAGTGARMSALSNKPSAASEGMASTSTTITTSTSIPTWALNGRKYADSSHIAVRYPDQDEDRKPWSEKFLRGQRLGIGVRVRVRV